ncbi:rab-GTPase-TBC domain-containing protein [Blakeslea trispora]|nr:rab-GTPase-TBC domain-containing protein [Blakeslea trispora]
MTITTKEVTMPQNINQHGIFHYLSRSTDKMFKERSRYHSPFEPTKDPMDLDSLLINSCDSSITLCSSYSDKSDISIDEDEDDDRFVLTPSSSTATTTSNIPFDIKRDEVTTISSQDQPWRLNHAFQLNDYFFIDRDEDVIVDAEIKRDAYGFKRPTQWIKAHYLHQFDDYYKPMLSRQRKAWKTMIDQHHGQLPPTEFPQLKINIHQGVPSEIRGKVWMHYSGASKKMEANPEVYNSLVKTAIKMGEYNEHAEMIQRDLHRTFPDNMNFECAYSVDQQGTTFMEPEKNSKLQSLKRILLAFTIYSPQIGYCQSLNYLAGLFLLFVDSEEEAFWLLVTTVIDFMPEKMYDVTMEGVHIDQSVLMMMIYEKLPDIWNKIASEGNCFWEDNQEKEELPHMTLITSHWFLTMFINILPVETVLRIWDCFFFEGYNVLFQMTLTIIQMNQEQILAMKDPIEIFQILRSMPKRLIDCHSFINHVFSPSNIFSTMDANDIAIKRNFFSDKLRQQCSKSKCSF